MSKKTKILITIIAFMLALPIWRGTYYTEYLGSQTVYQSTIEIAIHHIIDGTW